MKKIFLFFALIMSTLTSIQAGYLIRGIYTSIFPPSFKNFTLTLNSENELISAGTTNYNGANSIVIIKAYDDNAYFFPIVIDDENYPVEVRDIHYIGNDTYILCGSYGVGTVNPQAFVAKIYDDFNFMDFMIHPEASIYYSIRPSDNISTPGTPLNHFACGANNELGVISEIDPSTLQLLGLFKTEKPWVYHKIIAKRSTNNNFYLVASGRNPACDYIGFTVLDLQLVPNSNYIWEQLTEPSSLCVLCDYMVENNKFVLASSFATTITLNPITFPNTLFSQISAYRFTLLTTPGNIICVQDIDMSDIKDVNNPCISVAGFMWNPLWTPTQTRAWLGSVCGLSNSSIMDNFVSTGTFTGQYEHYKIRFDQNRVTYTGGYFQSVASRGAFFGTPFVYTEECNIITNHPIDNIDSLPWSSFYINSITPSARLSDTLSSTFDIMPIIYDCGTFTFKGNFPEFSMQLLEEESEFTNFYDRIVVKDIPTGTNYQIYSITGQLIRFGTTNPDVSTAQLSKGMYILRLETGKTFKFIK